MTADNPMHTRLEAHRAADEALPSPPSDAGVGMLRMSEVFNTEEIDMDREQVCASHEFDWLVPLEGIGDLSTDAQMAMLSREFGKSAALKVEVAMSALLLALRRVAGRDGVVELPEVERIATTVADCWMYPGLGGTPCQNSHRPRGSSCGISKEEYL